MVLFMAGNKSDLPNKKVTFDQAKSFGENHEIEAFEVSAKTGDHIQDLFKDLAEKLYKQMPQNPGA